MEFDNLRQYALNRVAIKHTKNKTYGPENSKQISRYDSHNNNK